MTVFRGLSAFPVTPADDVGRVDVDALARIVDRAVGAGVDSIGLLGSTGIYAYLAEDQRGRAVRAAHEAVAGRVPLIVGVGALRTDAAIRLAQDAAEGGADGLLLAAMSYTPLTQAEVEAHARAVADATDRPLCLYDNPSTTHFRFEDETVARLAEHPGVAALKAPPPDDMGRDVARRRAALPKGFALGYSGDWTVAAAFAAGADVFFSALAGTVPDPFVAVARGEAGAAPEPLLALCRTHGSLRVAYAAANALGLTDARPPLPVMPLDNAARAEVEAALP